MKSVCHSCTSLLEFYVHHSAKVSWHQTQYVNLTCDFFLSRPVYVIMMCGRFPNYQKYRSYGSWHFSTRFLPRNLCSYAWVLADEFPPSPNSFALSIFFPSLRPEGHERHLSKDAIGLEHSLTNIISFTVTILAKSLSALMMCTYCKPRWFPLEVNC
jgi:hypothetical protein